MSTSVGEFTAVDDTADTSWFIDFMDTTNAQPEYAGIRSSLIAELGPLSGRAVLDVGCGPGDDTREVAELVGPAGRVVGVDLSEAMLAEAKRRGGSVEFLQGDVHELPFPDASFDAVRAKLVRIHSPRIDTADDELVRVLRPGGRLAVFDYDIETCTLDHPDRTTTRTLINYWADAHHRQGWCGRQTRGRFLARGLKDVTVVPHTVRTPFELFRDVTIGPVTEAVERGLVDVSVEEWFAPLAAAQEQGRFFTALTGYVVSGTK
jgi:ubiquinone/menaquinone biosynthesis C-methylase UbiE